MSDKHRPLFIREDGSVVLDNEAEAMQRESIKQHYLSQVDAFCAGWLARAKWTPEPEEKPAAWGMSPEEA